MFKEVKIEILIIIIILIIILLIFVFRKINQRRLQKKYFENYSEFLGSVKSKDPHYNKKMHTIINLINKNKMTNLKEISRISGCDFYETILKIKFLKREKIIENFYIDRENGILNPCSEEDKKLIEKYDQFIYAKHLQPEYIAKSFPGTTFENLEEVKKQVLEELSYLDKKDLLNGINIDLVDKKIIYYDIEQLKKHKDYISITCESCGALNDVPRNGKSRCEYCERILEEEISKK